MITETIATKYLLSYVLDFLYFFGFLCRLWNFIDYIAIERVRSRTKVFKIEILRKGSEIVNHEILRLYKIHKAHIYAYKITLVRQRKP